MVKLQFLACTFIRARLSSQFYAHSDPLLLRSTKEGSSMRKREVTLMPAVVSIVLRDLITARAKRRRMRKQERERAKCFDVTDQLFSLRHRDAHACTYPYNSPAHYAGGSSLEAKRRFVWLRPTFCLPFCHQFVLMNVYIPEETFVLCEFLVFSLPCSLSLILLCATDHLRSSLVASSTFSLPIRRESRFLGWESRLVMRRPRESKERVPQ